MAISTSESVWLPKDLNVATAGRGGAVIDVIIRFRKKVALALAAIFDAVSSLATVSSNILANFIPLPP